MATDELSESVLRYLDQAEADGVRVDRSRVSAWAFGADREMAAELAALVVAGKKTATASCLWAYEEDEPRPRAGDVSVITDWDGEPLAIIETVEVEERRFDQVDAGFARDEGEGDLSLEYWRTGHWAFFAAELAALGKEPSETMPVLCERFRLLHKRRTAT